MSLRARTLPVPTLTWVQLSLSVGALLTALWTVWPSEDLSARIVRDGVTFILVPGALALAHDRHLGWRVDRRALRNTVLLAAFVLPFYLVGSSLPTVRRFYPMWGLDSTAPEPFLAHTVMQFVIVLGAETYYRGLLCVGVRDLGRKSVLISPVAYAVAHAAKPPIELLLSGPTDVLFGVVDYESDSILPSVVAHGAGFALLDWLVLHPPLFHPPTVVRWLSWLPVPL